MTSKKETSFCTTFTEESTVTRVMTRCRRPRFPEMSRETFCRLTRPSAAISVLHSLVAFKEGPSSRSTRIGRLIHSTRAAALPTEPLRELSGGL